MLRFRVGDRVMLKKAWRDVTPDKVGHIVSIDRGHGILSTWITVRFDSGLVAKHAPSELTWRQHHSTIDIDYRI